MNGKNLTVDNNMKVAAKRGVVFYERIWMDEPKTGVRYLSNVIFPLMISSLPPTQTARK
jgi:hypothetical protein